MSDILQQSDPNHPLRQLSRREQQEPLQSDAELLALFLEGGNRPAIEALIGRYAPMVASVCRLTVADAASAEDAFQATFLVLLKSAKKIKRHASLAAWLHGVAYRCACRMRKRQAIISNQDCDEVIAKRDTPDDPIAELARKMELEALDSELEKLPERLRGPLIEHYLLGFTAPEIAERMELSVSAVEGRLRRGRRALRTQLARRGIGLSVLVAGGTLFQQHVQATEAVSWTIRFMDSHLPHADGSPLEATHTLSSNPRVSSLASGEMSMIASGTMKATLAVSLLLLAGTLVALTVNAADTPQRGGTPQSAGLTLPAAVPPAASPRDDVFAQFAQATDAPTPDQAANTTSDEALTVVVYNVDGMNVQVAYETISQLLSGSPDVRLAQDTERKQLVLRARQTEHEQVAKLLSEMKPSAAIAWEQPEAAQAAEPSWLSGGRSAVAAIEKNREVLSTQLPLEFVGIPLSEVAQWLSDETGTQFELATHELDLMGVAADTPITLQAGPTSVREIIRRIGDPLELTYVVTESTIEITTKEAAEARDNMRFYDLAYVLPNSLNTQPLINAIQQSIDADHWLSSGGTCSIAVVGSMMIVNAPDTTHQKIEVLLQSLTQMNPKNAAQAVPINPPGGMGQGMGGMGGGMF